MKRWRTGGGVAVLALIALVGPAYPGASAGIEPGQSRDEVTAVLGAPSGSIIMGGREVLYYERGSVELREGRVVSADLVTAEEARRRREAERAAHLAWQRAEAARRARNKAEGEAELQRLLNDPVFLLGDPDSQVAVWHDVLRRYPEVPAGAHLAQALQRAEAARDRRERDTRIADLERRTAEAERQARQAAEEIERRRSMTTRTTVFMPYDPWTYTYYPGYHCAPPRRRTGEPSRSPPSRGGATSSFQSWPYDFSSGMRHSGGGVQGEWDSHSGQTRIRVGF